MRFLSFMAALALTVSPLSADMPKGHDHGGKNAAPPKGVAGFDVAAEGATLHLVTGRYNPGGAPGLDYLRSDDGGATWSAPVAVDKGLPALYRAEAGDIRVAARNNVVMAVWSASGPGPMKSGSLVAAVSRDGGKTWEAAANPSSEGGGHGRRFPALTTDAGGAFHIAWLDRKDKSAVRYARSEDGGKSWSAEKTLDDDACECCWNSIAVSPEGAVYVLYRDREPRDMAVAVSADGGHKWAAGKPAGAFGWNINACPHTGGGLTVAGSNVLASVWTGEDEKMGLYCMVSGDNAKSWAAPRPLGSAAAKFSDLAAEGAQLASVWEETSEKGQRLMSARSTDGGKTWSEAAALKAAPLAGGPRVAASGTGFRAFWVEKSPDGTRAWKSAAF